MAMHETVDVVGIGARAAGAATAMLLARRGLDVLLVDRGSYGSDTLSTHALMRGAVLQLDRWGLLPRIIASGTPAVHRTAFHYAQEVVDIAIKPSHGVGAFYAPRRAVLDPILVDAARDAGAEVRFQTGLVDLVRRADGRVAGVVLKGPEGRVRTVMADLAFADDAGQRLSLSLPLYRFTDEIASFGWDLDRLGFLQVALNKAMQAEVEHLASLPSHRHATAFLTSKPTASLEMTP